jgi:hypothetical protein
VSEGDSRLLTAVLSLAGVAVFESKVQGLRWLLLFRSTLFQATLQVSASKPDFKWELNLLAGRSNEGGR